MILALYVLAVLLLCLLVCAFDAPRERRTRRYRQAQHRRRRNGERTFPYDAGWDS